MSDKYSSQNKWREAIKGNRQDILSSDLVYKEDGKEVFYKVEKYYYPQDAFVGPNYGETKILFIGKELPVRKDDDGNGEWKEIASSQDDGTEYFLNPEEYRGNNYHAMGTYTTALKLLVEEYDREELQDYWQQFKDNSINNWPDRDEKEDYFPKFAEETNIMSYVAFCNARRFVNSDRGAVINQVDKKFLREDIKSLEPEYIVIQGNFAHNTIEDVVDESIHEGDQEFLETIRNATIWKTKHPAAYVYEGEDDTPEDLWEDKKRVDLDEKEGITIQD